MQTGRTVTIIAVLLFGVFGGYAAETTAGVSGIFGPAFADTGSGEMPLRVGMKVRAGTTIRTGPRGAADIFLGKEPSVIRLTQNTIVRIEQVDRTNDTSTTYLHLQQGAILGNGSNVREGSRYQIKTAIGIAGITSGAFRVHGEGYFVLLNGQAHFAHVPASGDPKLHNLNAPPAVYFSGTEGVKPAPKELVSEIVNQSKARLGQ